MLLEDLHWTDGSSLDAVTRLAASLSVGAAGTSPLLLVCAARPSLYQRRPGWGEGRAFHSRLDLDPLSRQDSRRLVGEILQRMEQVPGALRDLVVGGAEGNPFFLEELIKMLIEEGVIRKGERAWSVDEERLDELRVPPTLTGVLQARLDRLPFDQRQVLQQASVVGRLFWDLAVAHIAAAARPDRAEAQTEAESEAIGAALAALGGREMVFPQARSAFEGAEEYLFKHALLREVTYEGVLKRVRRAYHGLVAGWLMEQAGERAGEYTGLIAGHLSLAGRREEAVRYLRRAAEQAAASYANEEAAGYYSRALELTPEERTSERYALLLAREALYDLLGRPEERGHDLAALETLAAALDGGCPVEDRVHQADIALRRAEYERFIGNHGASLDAVQAAVRLAQEAGDRVREAKSRRAWGWTLSWKGEYDGARRQYEQALALARESGARQVEADTLTGLGWAFWHSGTSYATVDTTSDEEGVPLSHEQALHLCHEQALRLYRETGDRRGEATALNALGVLYVGQGELPKARTYYEETLAIQREIGNRLGEAGPTGNLAWVYRGEDDYAGAIECLERELAIRREVGHRPLERLDLIDIGQTLGAQGHYTQGEDLIWQACRVLGDTGGQDPGGAELSDLGLIRYYQGDYAQARAFLEKALPLRKSAAPFEQSKDRAVLSLISHAQGDDEAALDFAQQSLERGRDRYHLGRGDSALVRGHALSGLGDAEGATAAYQQALLRYRQSGFLNPPMEALAGLARVALEQRDPAQALLHVEEILDHLQAHTLDGTYEPFRIYLTCVRVLQAHEDARAAGVLRTAHTLLQERAAGIEDERLRRSFLENVPAHQELIREYEQPGPGG
jgi:tetratricopeptide (TPR) repeat protein